MFWLFLAFMVAVVFFVGAFLAQIDTPKPKPVSKRRFSQLTILDPEKSSVVIINKPKGRQE